MHDTSWLLGDCPLEQFADEFWQTRPGLIATGRTGHYAPLFGSAALEQVIEYGQPNSNSIRLASTVGPQRREVPRRADGRIDIAKLRKSYVEGETVVLNNVEDFDRALARLVQAMEVELSLRVQTNCYITPPNGQGFRPHYDTHDVLVAQVEGRKLWRIYGGDSVCPLNELIDGDPIRRSSTEPVTEVWLEDGDLLYIPRGWIHEASTADVASLHLTFGLHAPLGCDLLSAALECLVRLQPELRDPLPLGFAGSDRLAPQVDALFERMRTLFANQASAADARRVVEDGLLRRGRVGGDGQLFCDMNMLDQISPTTPLERRPNVAVQVLETPDGVGLRFHNSLLRVPPEASAAMQFIVERAEPFMVDAIPDLTADEKIALAKSLVRDGLCRMAEPAWQ
jgi:ribosomal protein L16 Arg81 hydroxylase